MAAHDALKTHCKRNHELTEENIQRTPGYPTRRQCKACQREVRLRNQYGMGAKEFAEELLKQDGLCLICKCAMVVPAPGTKTTPDQAVVDHDHKTGAHRGILCSRCNLGLGKFRDDPNLLTAALAYLLN